MFWKNIAGKDVLLEKVFKENILKKLKVSKFNCDKGYAIDINEIRFDYDVLYQSYLKNNFNIMESLSSNEKREWHLEQIGKIKNPSFIAQKFQEMYIVSLNDPFIPDCQTFNIELPKELPEYFYESDYAIDAHQVLEDEKLVALFPKVPLKQIQHVQETFFNILANTTRIKRIAKNKATYFTHVANEPIIVLSGEEKNIIMFNRRCLELQEMSYLKLMSSLPNHLTQRNDKLFEAAFENYDERATIFLLEDVLYYTCQKYYSMSAKFKGIAQVI